MKLTSVKDLIAEAKKRPGELNYSSSGIGSPNHLAMEMFQANTNTSLVHIPYKGGGPSVNELLGGFVDVAINAIPSVIQHVKSGKLTALAVAGASRDHNLPKVPTMAEAGVTGFEYEIWYGVFAPVKTPPSIVSKVSGDLQQVLKDPQVILLLDAQGATAKPSTAEEFTRYIRNDTDRWKRIIQDRNIRAE